MSCYCFLAKWRVQMVSPEVFLNALRFMQDEFVKP